MTTPKTHQDAARLILGKAQPTIKAEATTIDPALPYNPR